MQHLGVLNYRSISKRVISSQTPEEKSDKQNKVIAQYNLYKFKTHTKCHLFYKDISMNKTSFICILHSPLATGD